MSGEFSIAEEEIAIPQNLIDAAFRNGLKSHKLLYLDDLKKIAMTDSFFDGKRDQLQRAFDEMKLYIGSQGSNINTISMKQFKLPPTMIERLGYLAHQRSVVSPVNNGTSSRSRGFQRSPSVQSEDNYDDDFEEEEVEEEYEDDNDNRTASRAQTVSMSRNNPINTLTNNFVGGSTPSPTKSCDPIRNGPTYPNNNRKFQVIEERKFSDWQIKDGTSKIQPQPTQSVEFSAKSSNKQGPLYDDTAAVSQSRKHKQPQWIDQREWRLGEKIGSGSFGEVYQAMNHKGKLFAVKKMNIIDKSSEVKNLIQEIRLMSVLSHKNIVQYLGSWVDEEQGCLYIFQEWVPGGSVAHLLKQFGPFSVTTVRFYTRQILAGLQYLHNNSIVHRDIKGGNILVDDSGTVKLADFGASTTLNDFNKTQETTTIKGTPYFMAPEVLSSSKYGRKGDIWAVGCTMIQMFTGEPPWKDKNLKSLIQLHILLSGWNEGPPPHNCRLPSDAEECLELCFKKNPDERPTAVELLQCRYLRDNDDLDDSYNMDQSFYKKHDGGGLSDSGLINRLETAIDSAVSKSRTSIAIQSRHGQNDDTFEVIERRMKERGSNKVADVITNPDPGSTPTRKGNDNPFGKNIAPKPAGIAPLPLDYNAPSSSANPTPRLTIEHGSVKNYASTNVNSSVHLIKKKISDATTIKGNTSPGRSRSNSRHNSPRLVEPRRTYPSSQSSNRDSEELTPQAYDIEDDYERDTTGGRSKVHARSGSYDSQGDDNEINKQVGRVYPLERYDTRYYEEKQRDEDGEKKIDREEFSEQIPYQDRRGVKNEIPYHSNITYSKKTTSDGDGGIRKSSSTADGIGLAHGSSRNNVPRLAHIEYSTDRPAPSSIGKSSSARMPRHVEHTDPSNRPATSKAALGYSKPTVAGNVDAKGMIKKATHHASLQQIQQTEDFSVDHDETWVCLKCKASNTNPDHCDYCATVRGTSGVRDPRAPLQKRY